MITDSHSPYLTTRPTHIVFDVDGVVCVGSSFTAHLEREHSIASEKLARFFATIFKDCLVGQKDLADELSGLLPTIGWAHSTDAFLEFWFSRENVLNQPLLVLVEKLRGAGICCSLGTNQERHRLNYLRRQMGLEARFDAIFASCELGVVKPNAGFFEQVIQETKCHPHDLLLVDDSVTNTAAAEALGIRAWLYRDYPFLEKFLTE